MLILSQTPVSSAETENVRPCLGIRSEIGGKQGRQDKTGVARDLTGDHCIWKVLEKFMELMACEVTLEGEKGLFTGHRGEILLEIQAEELESNTGCGTKSICGNAARP